MEQDQSSNKWLWVILIIVILIGAGFWTWVLMNQNKPVATPIVTPVSVNELPTIEPSVSPSVSASPISMVDWKTYTNTTYGYSIKYPSDWTAKDMHTTFGVADTYGFEPPSTSANWTVTVNVDNASQYGKTIQEGSEGTATTFAGKQATKYTYANGYEYQIQENNKYYVVSIEFSNGDDNLKPTADQIVSTFQFTK